MWEGVWLEIYGIGFCVWYLIWSWEFENEWVGEVRIGKGDFEGGELFGVCKWIEICVMWLMCSGCI